MWGPEFESMMPTQSLTSAILILVRNNITADCVYDEVQWEAVLNEA